MAHGPFSQVSKLKPMGFPSDLRLTTVGNGLNVIKIMPETAIKVCSVPSLRRGVS